MSKKASPTSIGLFFAVGLALSVAGLLLFSSRSLFHPVQKDILYFDASLKGLNPGAPVKFRGVTIGSVVEVLIRHNQSSNDFSMPVIIAIDKKLAQAKSDEALQIGIRARVDHLIQRGLRGRMDAESLVTGVLYVALDIVPNAPPPEFHQLKPEYLEIPTVPTEVQQLLSNLAHIDVRGLSERLNALLAHADESLGRLNFAQINEGLTNLLVAANHLIGAPDLTNTVTAARGTLEKAQALLKRIDVRVDPLADNVTNTLYDAQKTLAGLHRTFDSLLGPDASIPSDLTQALEELANASRALADLAEFLQSNPNALLAGRKRPKAEP